MTERLITKRREEIFRLCHHDFAGLSQTEAADVLDISPSAISDALIVVEKVMPQFFPILTKLEARCYHFYIVDGWSINQIAEYINSTPNAVYKTLQRARDKGMFFTEAKGRILSYESSMDADIKQKF